MTQSQINNKVNSMVLALRDITKQATEMLPHIDELLEENDDDELNDIYDYVLDIRQIVAKLL
jgi:hypothetical protein